MSGPLLHPEANPGGHIRSLDALRGALALYVALHHIGFLYSDWWRAAGNLPWLFTKFSAFGHEAVIAFFLLSGFAMMRSHGGDPLDPASLNRYAFRRVRRLYGVYLGALLLTALFSLHRGGTSLAIQQLPANLLMLQAGGGPWWRQTYLGNTPLWSLSFEAAYYLAFPALLLLGRRLGPRALVGTVAAFGTAGWIGVWFGGFHDASIAALLPTWWIGAWLASPDCAALRWRVPSWLAGYGVGLVPLLSRSVPDAALKDLLVAVLFLPLFARLLQGSAPPSSRHPSAPVLTALLLIHAIGALLLFLGDCPSTSGAFERTYLAAPLVLAMFAPALERAARRPLVRPALLGLCGISYGLYACHFPVLALGRDLAAAWHPPALVSLAIAWTALAAAISLAWLLEHPLHRRWADWLGRRWPR
ncbi:MAG: acyltransferase family protein [Verrucomicrobiia bacterium]